MVHSQPTAVGIHDNQLVMTSQARPVTSSNCQPSAHKSAEFKHFTMNANTSDTFNAIVDLLDNNELSEEEVLVQLRSRLESDPRVVLEQDFRGETLLHKAVILSAY